MTQNWSAQHVLQWHGAIAELVLCGNKDTNNFDSLK